MNIEEIKQGLAEEITRLERAYELLGGMNGNGRRPINTNSVRPVTMSTDTPGQFVRKPRRPMSKAGRKKIAAAQRARWAKVRSELAPTIAAKLKPKARRRAVKAVKPKRIVSAAARKKIAAAQRARWAKKKQTPAVAAA